MTRRAPVSSGAVISGALPSRGVERTIVLWCPDWPVTAAMTAGAIARHAPFALIENGLVLACSAVVLMPRCPSSCAGERQLSSTPAR